ncbi:hypothetical protein LER56_33530, partial [Pseudomonas aeruginosa]|uniref:hypothetical protein n=1 Tax=Pseudomonas aeruginosa TaxID=287 RepID=UPI003891FD57
KMPWQCGMMLRLQFNNRVALSSCNRPSFPFLSLLLEISHLGISPNPLRRATAQASQGLNRS